MWLLVALVALLLALAWRAEKIAAKNWQPTTDEINRLLRSLGLPAIAAYSPFVPRGHCVVWEVNQHPLNVRGLPPLKWDHVPGPVVFFPGPITITELP